MNDFSFWFDWLEGGGNVSWWRDIWNYNQVAFTYSVSCWLLKLTSAFRQRRLHSNAKRALEAFVFVVRLDWHRWWHWKFKISVSQLPIDVPSCQTHHLDSLSHVSFHRPTMTAMPFPANAPLGSAPIAPRLRHGRLDGHNQIYCCLPFQPETIYAAPS